MAEPRSPSSTFLICRSGAELCALPIEHVVETMRPLPTQPIPDMPSFMLGVAIVRGVPTPVVHVATLVGQKTQKPPTRFVSIKLGLRRLAFAVEDVMGIRTLDTDVLADIPLLVQSVDCNHVAAISVLDEELLLVLQSARLVPSTVWAALDQQVLPA